ncbi:WhiB family transcriptional regulator [Mycobacterium sp. 852002-51057_SCH5723018]|uniref:WhiB family transcriptional regulator n=1 Tax=Mycobacterium sp. 852002-51057_SCH5723018 TaxID=1834094 RepID=UPI0007FBBE2B|nr:WhiB family transcriptional regulator [Mycobacterium sp. 852002-51057_SCH5723018]OBG27535.1 transcriptional regulator [Mycobacterium sp. 852002-51057_SCH5723018]
MSRLVPAVNRTDTTQSDDVVRGANSRETSGWASEALCQTLDPDELFVSGADQRRAAAICRRCPVMYQCGVEALENKVEFGVWGGMTERQRRAILKRHPEVVSWSAFLDRHKARNVS